MLTALREWLEQHKDKVREWLAARQEQGHLVLDPCVGTCPPQAHSFCGTSMGPCHLNPLLQVGTVNSQTPADSTPIVGS